MPLPVDVTELFGREAELAEIERRLAQGVRLLTVVGLAGIGKSRLAHAAARRHGGRVVNHAALDEARSLEAGVRHVARALGVRIPSSSSARAAAEALASAVAAMGPSVLVLEHLEGLGVAARDLVSALLAGAPQLTVLATSRADLGVRGEERLVLAPLDQASGRALFLDRARAAAGRTLEIDEADLDAILSRTDLLPLAIELAAARLSVLSPGELRARLAKLDVLADRSGRIDRHTTMRAALDDSWALLDARERGVLARASVFAAPFGLEAAEALLGRERAMGADAVDDATSADEVVDVLESLIRKSLLVRADRPDATGAALTMYRTVRAWAGEKLDELDAREVAEARHARFHLARAERLAAAAYGADAARALDALTDLAPELLAGFESQRERAPEVAARIVVALTDVLLFRGFLELRVSLFEAGAEAAERAGDPRLLARSRISKARVTLEVGRMQDAERELELALALAEAEADEALAAEATRSLGWLFIATNRTAEAEEALGRARLVHRRLESARGEADACAALGILRALQGRREEALGELRRSLAIHVESGDVVRQEKVLGFSSLVGVTPDEVARGLPREVLARAPAASLEALPPQVAEAVREHADTGQRWREAVDLYRRGAALDQRGEPARAVAAFESALGILAKAGIARGAAAIRAHAALALAEKGELAEAENRIESARALAGGDPGGERVISLFASAVEVVRARLSGGAAEEAAERSARERLASAARIEGAPPELVVARAALDRVLRGAATPCSSALVVGPEGRWLVLADGTRVDLVRHGPVRRLLDALVTARLERPGEALSAEALIEAGWPGERMRHSAGLLRVYSTVRRLRRLGLGEALVTRDDGYLLDVDGPQVVRAT